MLKNYLFGIGFAIIVYTLAMCNSPSHKILKEPFNPTKPNIIDDGRSDCNVVLSNESSFDKNLVIISEGKMYSSFFSYVVGSFIAIDEKQFKNYEDEKKKSNCRLVKSGATMLNENTVMYLLVTDKRNLLDSIDQVSEVEYGQRIHVKGNTLRMEKRLTKRGEKHDYKFPGMELPERSKLLYVSELSVL